MAYATALSYPLPLVGVFFTNQGGYAGLSVATVSCPGVCSMCLSCDLVQLVGAAPPLLGELPQAASPPEMIMAAQAAMSGRAAACPTRALRPALMNRRILPTPTA